MRRLATALLLAFAALTPAAHAGTPPSNFSDNVVVSGLNAPTAIAFLPDRNMLVTEKGGGLLLVSGGGATTLATIPVCTASEMGRLGVAGEPELCGNDRVL